MNLNRDNFPVFSFLVFAASIVGRQFLPDFASELPLWVFNILENTVIFAFWIALALIINFFIDRFIWPRLYGPPIPGQPRQRKLLMQLVHVSMVAVAIGLALKQILLPNLGTMVAGSGVIAIVLGLALQNTLGDFFAGVALNIERPFKAGEWITLEDKTEGLVLSVNWRATHIKTRTWDVLIIPNSVVAKNRLINRMQPNRTHITSVLVKLMPGFDLELLSSVMSRSALAVKGVGSNAKPMVFIETFGEWTVSVRMYYFTEEYENLLVIQGEVASAVYKAIASDERLRSYWPRQVLARFGSEADTSLGPGLGSSGGGSGKSTATDQA